MSSSKKIDLHVYKGTLRQVRQEIHSVMLVFSTQLCELLSLYPSLWFNLPPPLTPSLCQSTVYTDSVWLGGVEVGGVESCWRTFPAVVSDQIQNLQNC